MADRHEHWRLTRSLRQSWWYSLYRTSASVLSQLYDPEAAVILEVLAWARNQIQAFTCPKFSFPLFRSFQLPRSLKTEGKTLSMKSISSPSGFSSQGLHVISPLGQAWESQEATKWRCLSKSPGWRAPKEWDTVILGVPCTKSASPTTQTQQHANRL